MGDQGRALFLLTLSTALGLTLVSGGTGPIEANPDHVAELIKKFGATSVETRERAGAKEMRLKTLAELRKAFEEPDKFLFILGEEISDKFLERVQGRNVLKPIHHISMNHVHLI